MLLHLAREIKPAVFINRLCHAFVSYHISLRIPDSYQTGQLVDPLHQFSAEQSAGGTGGDAVWRDAEDAWDEGAV